MKLRESLMSPANKTRRCTPWNEIKDSLCRASAPANIPTIPKQMSWNNFSLLRPHGRINDFIFNARNKLERSWNDRISPHRERRIYVSHGNKITRLRRDAW